VTIEIKEFYSIIHCDKCPNYMEVQDTDFESLIIELVNVGWRVQKDDNDCWENVCPVCLRIPGVYKGLLND